jgi:hypothetical protein
VKCELGSFDRKEAKRSQFRTEFGAGRGGFDQNEPKTKPREDRSQEPEFRRQESAPKTARRRRSASSQKIRHLRPDHNKVTDDFETGKSERVDAMSAAAHKQFPGTEPSDLLRSVLAMISSQICNTLAAGGD